MTVCWNGLNSEKRIKGFGWLPVPISHNENVVTVGMAQTVTGPLKQIPQSPSVESKSSSLSIFDRGRFVITGFVVLCPRKALRLMMIFGPFQRLSGSISNFKLDRVNDPCLYSGIVPQWPMVAPILSSLFVNWWQTCLIPIAQTTPFILYINSEGKGSVCRGCLSATNTLRLYSPLACHLNRGPVKIQRTTDKIFVKCIKGEKWLCLWLFFSTAWHLQENFVPFGWILIVMLKKRYVWQMEDFGNWVVRWAVPIWVI